MHYILSLFSCIGHSAWSLPDQTFFLACIKTSTKLHVQEISIHAPHSSIVLVSITRHCALASSLFFYPYITYTASFSGNIIIEAKKKALEEAKKYHAGDVFWVDGSKFSQGHVGAAACWKEKDLNKWENKSDFLGKNKDIIDAELWAITIGLETARKLTVNSRPTSVTIFSDSREALTSLGQLSSQARNTYLRSLICQKVSDLESKGRSVTIQWIPRCWTGWA